MAWGWTRAERRGASVVLALYLLGTAWDLYRAAHPLPASRVAASRPAGAARPALSSATPAPPAAAADSPLDLNQATESELDRLPGIGPVLARRIAMHRNEAGPFRRVQDLRAVRGVGPRLYERIAPHVRVLSPSAAAADSSGGHRSAGAAARSPAPKNPGASGTPRRPRR